MIQVYPRTYGNHYLYRHIREDRNEPFYVGIGTKGPIEKRYGHYHRASVKRRHRSWNEIVAETEYTIEILLESNDYGFIKQKEQEFIKLYGRINNGTGILVNLTDGGEGTVGWIPSEALKKQWSEKRRGEANCMYGKPRSEETKEKIAEKQRGVLNHNYGKKASQQTRKKMSGSQRGREKDQKEIKSRASSLKGRKLSEETKKKISEAAKNRKKKPSIPRMVINTETKKIYKSIKEAASDEYSFGASSLSERLSGKRKNNTPYVYYIKN